MNGAAAMTRRIMQAALAATTLVLITGGIWLTFFYQPTTAQAWDDITTLQDENSWGSLIQVSHRWIALGWLLIVAAAALVEFISRRVVAGIVTSASLLIGLVVAYLGLLLPWDQLALWQVTVGTNIRGFTPVFGDEVRFVLLDGREISTTQLRTWYLLHVIGGVAVLAAPLAAVLLRRSADQPPRPSSPPQQQPHQPT